MAGRPKKEVVPSSQEQSNNLETNNQPQNLTHEAFGIYKGSDNQWYVASIKYDPVTGATGEFKSKVAGPGRDFGIEQFKIDVANALMS